MKTETAKALLIGFAVLILGYWAIGMFRGDGSGNGPEAPAAPMGFFGVKWYVSMDEVKAARPKVVAENDDTLAEDERFYGEDVKVRYVFKGGHLVLFVMTFTSPATKEAFDAFQPKLSQDYGAMSSPTRRADCQLFSENKVDKLVVNHCLRVRENQNPEHQVLFYRTII